MVEVKIDPKKEKRRSDRCQQDQDKTQPFQDPPENSGERGGDHRDRAGDREPLILSPIESVRRIRLKMVEPRVGIIEPAPRE